MNYKIYLVKDEVNINENIIKYLLENEYISQEQKEELVKPLKYSDFLNSLSTYDFQRKDLTIGLESVKYQNQITGEIALLKNEDNDIMYYCQMEDNPIHDLLWRVGNIIFAKL